MKLTLEQTDLIIDTALAEARSRNFARLGIAVLDSGGNLIAFKREDGATIARFEIAFGKAWGAIGMGFGTRELAERAKLFPAFVSAIAVSSNGRMIPSPGGVLILDENKEIIGAAGVSGDTGDNDEICAVAGITAAGFDHATGMIKK